MSHPEQPKSMRVKDHEILRVYLPDLPNKSAQPDSMKLSDRIFFENVAESFTELQTDGSTRHRAIEAVTMSLDGLTYRITLRKGMKFHCGAEITAEDAVSCIAKVLKNKNSASQLQRFVAKSRPGQMEIPVQAVSRYRFEVHLERRMSDFLQRLSLPEFALRHDDRDCFSGMWKINGSDEAGINLAPHLEHADVTPADYKMIRIEAIDAEDVGNLNFSDVPFVFAYEGTFCKSPSQSVLQDETIRSAVAGTSYFLRCEKPERMPGDVRKALINGARRFFSENSLWRRLPLTSGVPDGHLAHIPFAMEISGDVRGGDFKVCIDEADSSLPRRVLDSFKRFASAEYGLEIVYSSDPEAETLVFDLKIEKMTCTHPADIYSPLSQEIRHPKLLKTSLITELEMKRKSPVVTYLQNLVKDGFYLPFVYVPWMVRSNRPLKAGNDGRTLNFSSVGQSEFRSRRRKVQEKSLLALGNAVQMFVHDVKRPFSLVQGILSLLESTDDATRIKDIVRKYVPDVKRTIKSVDGLIQDILEIGSDAEPACDEVSFRKLLLDVLGDIFLFEKDAEIEFSFDIQHRQALYVDSHKINRVIQNLIANALQAMKRKGRIWVNTRDLGTGYVEVCVGNSNSFIAPGKIIGLFERFYTDGNKKGTGLGLAISHKIVTDHGGRIWCQSDRVDGTGFYFTVPVSKADDPAADLVLPATVGDIVARHQISADAGRNRMITIGGSGVSVLMLDDDRLYLEVTRELLTAAEQTSLNIRFSTANDFKGALEEFKKGRFDIVIADVDLGSKTENGLDFVREIRRMNQKIRICVHSNGSPFELQRRVIEAGGDLFLPKPMTRDHLISLLETTAKDASKRAKTVHIAVVDDDALMIEMWESVGRYRIHPFFSPEEFLEQLTPGSNLIAELSCIISDFTFPESELDGLDLIGRIRALGFKNPVVLMTDRPLAPDHASGCDVLPKDIQKGLEYLSRMLPTE